MQDCVITQRTLVRYAVIACGTCVGNNPELDHALVNKHHLFDVRYNVSHIGLVFSFSLVGDHAGRTEHSQSFSSSVGPDVDRRSFVGRRKQATHLLVIIKRGRLRR